MSKPSYSFNNFDVHYGYMGGPVANVSKDAVWKAVQNDPEFWKLKQFKIKVKKESYYPGSVVPNGVYYETSYYWCKTKTEANKIGEVLEQIR